MKTLHKIGLLATISQIVMSKAYSLAPPGSGSSLAPPCATSYQSLMTMCLMSFRFHV